MYNCHIRKIILKAAIIMNLDFSAHTASPSSEIHHYSLAANLSVGGDKNISE